MLPQLQQDYKQETLSRQFNQIIKPKITDNPNKIMYSFRHTIATNLMRLDVNMDIVSEILGHSYTNSSMTKEVYANGYTLKQLKDAIDTLEL
jgi:integrase